MDPGSMGPPFGPDPWTTYMDPVHGQVFCASKQVGVSNYFKAKKTTWGTTCTCIAAYVSLHG